jgi:hypothetical protein
MVTLVLSCLAVQQILTVIFSAVSIVSFIIRQLINKLKFRAQQFPGFI